MAKTRDYSWVKHFFEFQCPSEWCPNKVGVGFDRLLAQSEFECYVCGARVQVQNHKELAEQANRALTALIAVHEEMDMVPFVTWVTFFNDATFQNVVESNNAAEEDQDDEV